MLLQLLVESARADNGGESEMTTLLDEMFSSQARNITWWWNK